MSVGFRFEIESPVFLWCVTRLSHAGSVRWTAKIVLAYCKRQCLGHTDCVVLLTHKVIKKARIGNYNAMIVGTVNGRLSVIPMEAYFCVALPSYFEFASLSLHRSNARESS